MENNKDTVTMKKVLDLHFGKEYVVKESEIYQGFFFPDGFHTFFNDLSDYQNWLVAAEENEDYNLLQTYFDEKGINYDFLPFEGYLKNEEIKELFTTYKFLWNSHNQSITPTKVFFEQKNYGVKQFGATPKTFIIMWNEEHKFDECIPIKLLEDVEE